MGVQEPILLAMLLFSFFSLASFSPLSKNLVSVNTHENMGDHKGIDKKDSVIGGGGRMVNEGKYATTVRAVRGGGGGGAVIPVYAAGQNRIHTGAAPCRKGGLLVLIATSAYLLLHIIV